MIKNGTQHIAMLHDGREVYLNGQAVANVTEHPAFRNSI
ncbi:MAG: 4-hydroxyphenylacetate 3-monooxygenase, partial [Jatrophihabitans sp.]|nr:4-hydroxyphenylacetate 3-monooxygenase [Jatrophihabitans sp.]